LPKASKELAMAKKYVVDLNEGEKADLVALIQKGRSGARKIKRANILLLANAGKPDIEIAELLQTSWLTVLRTRHRFVEGGLDFALKELARAGRLPKIDDKIETILTTLAQNQPPDGRVRWTLQLLRYDFEYRREGTCNLFMFLHVCSDRTVFRPQNSGGTLPNRHLHVQSAQ
jgi:transposase